jgi:transposase
MSYPTAELLGRVERRRRFSVEQKLAILTEATARGANLSEVARRHGIGKSRLAEAFRLSL